MSLYGEQARYFEREDLPKMKHTRMGVVSFVNNGNNMLGSQFFITLGENLDYLDDKHTIFGQVTEGIDTLEKMNEQLCDGDHKPYRDIRIAHTIVLDDPFEDPPRLEYPRRSPSPTFEMLVQTNKIALDENVDDFEGKTAEEIAEEIKKRDMAEQAQILEMVGDLRHADEAPPDNVLFVCKLNPVTTDEDLEIIFSRFGKIIKCEVIRDRRTQQSLQYAFIEFDDPKSCEQAFFKMDNVLIDDRRIHVDFSQSVAKLHQGYKEGKAQRYDADEEHKRSQKPRRSPVRKNMSPRRNGNEERRIEKHRSSKRSPEIKREPVSEKKHRDRSRSRDDLPQKYRRQRSPERPTGRRSRSKERAPRDSKYTPRSKEKLRSRENRDRHDSRERQRVNKKERPSSRERRRRRSESGSTSPEKSKKRERSRSPGRKKHRK